ncbi:MAG: hypothetical protein EOO53_20555 [Gammaproteobacteria bacterium]|nr:MAG: hypothetical protein EOO53_20555 [Gammaproteobacteria bacterium]
MRQTLMLLTATILLLFYSCKKLDHQLAESDTHDLENNVAARFFSAKGHIDPAAQIVLNEIKLRNTEGGFVNDFAKTNGFPIWAAALVASNPNQDTVVYIPLVLNKTRFVNGFIKAVIRNGITISNFKSSDYSNYPFTESASFSADNFASLMMYFDNKAFQHDQFILTDARLFPHISAGKNQFRGREIKLKKISQGNSSSRSNRSQTSSISARTSNCEYLTIVIDWLEKDAANCTCNDKANCDWATGCSDCSNLHSSSFSFNSCGGSSGGPATSSGGTWSPAPPPGGGGSNSTIATPSGGYLLYPNTQEYFDFVDYTLTPNERVFWDDPSKAEFVAPLIRKLVQGNYSSATVAYIQNWLSYLMGNPDITPAEFQNYFMYEAEGADGEYDAAYWDDPNLTLPLDSLPSWATFRAAFPKIVDAQTNQIYPMDADSVYNLVGGIMQTNHNNLVPGWKNACAIRLSRGLNYCGKPIISNSSKVYLGRDAKKYIVSAKAINKYMNKKFGAPTYRLTAAQINGDPQEIVKFLRGKTGIYTMVTSGGSYTGHADLIENGNVLSGPATDPVSNVAFIEIWELK